MIYRLIMMLSIALTYIFSPSNSHYSRLIKLNPNQTSLMDSLYQNPVFEPVLADPTVVQSGGYFYAYGTEDNWGEEGGYHLLPVLKSKDLIHWDYLADAMQKKPDWKDKGGIWAPDVSQVGEQFYMYYSFSTWGDKNPGIGLAIADHPQGPFEDQGKVFSSQEIGVDNSIDPFYIEEEGQKYLFWGSFHGIYVTALSADGKQAVGEKKRIASNHLEAAYVFKKNDYYYLFGSSGSCCEGENSTYRILVGRSQNLMGPYHDKAGNKLNDGPYGELLVAGSDDFVGPGHNAEVITDDAGQDWLLYHAMKKDHARLDIGTNRRSLMLDQLHWKEGWPQIVDNIPGKDNLSVPKFKH